MLSIYLHIYIYHSVYIYNITYCIYVYIYIICIYLPRTWHLPLSYGGQGCLKSDSAARRCVVGYPLVLVEHALLIDLIVVPTIKADFHWFSIATVYIYIHLYTFILFILYNDTSVPEGLHHGKQHLYWFLWLDMIKLWSLKASRLMLEYANDGFTSIHEFSMNHLNLQRIFKHFQTFFWWGSKNIWISKFEQYSIHAVWSHFCYLDGWHDKKMVFSSYHKKPSNRNRLWWIYVK